MKPFFFPDPRGSISPERSILLCIFWSSGVSDFFSRYFSPSRNHWLFIVETFFAFFFAVRQYTILLLKKLFLSQPAARKQKIKWNLFSFSARGVNYTRKDQYCQSTSSNYSISWLRPSFLAPFFLPLFFLPPFFLPRFFLPQFFSHPYCFRPLICFLAEKIGDT